jgi:hypothetical protein
MFLDNYLQTAGISESVSEVIANLVNAMDHGLTALFEATCYDSTVLRPPDSIHQVQYLIAHCPRLRQLLQILDAEGGFSDSTPRPRFLIFSHWPIVSWLIEMVLQRLGLYYANRRINGGTLPMADTH